MSYQQEIVGGTPMALPLSHPHLWQ